jgi:putative ABC transport system permease protein
VECEAVGLLGGVLGIGLSMAGLAAVNGWAMATIQRGDLFRIDLTMGFVAFGLSLLAGLVAGLYPAWRVCRIPPALHLKLQ